MSRCYQMHVEIQGFRKDRRDAIVAALSDLWEFEDWDETEDLSRLYSTGNDQLTGGCTEQEFAQQCCEEAWKANGDFCQVSVQATCLEPGNNDMTGTRKDYQAWRRKQQKERIDEARRAIGL